jgi:protein-S-isoprenylcysteine O-methyltransferase Ste14
MNTYLLHLIFEFTSLNNGSCTDPQESGPVKSQTVNYLKVISFLIEKKYNGENSSSDKTLTRSVFWTSAAFYGLIALEFFYMFSPFAAYFYGVSGPGLELLAAGERTSRLIAFFMPHIARDTQSFFITWHDTIGGLFFLAGLLGFLVGAVRIYWNKLKKRGAVTDGIYRHIRHPQYLALMIASFGMVLIWPRYLVLFGFITVCFAYYFLARMEEKICEDKFPEYESYLRETGRFLPKKIESLFLRMPVPSRLPGKVAGAIILYVLLMTLSFTVARGINSYSVAALYTWHSPDRVMLSVGNLDDEEFTELRQIAEANPDVASRLADASSEFRYIWYVMPADLFISEIPMHIPDGVFPSHESPGSKDQSRYKIIVTKAEFGAGEPANGLDILRRAIHKTPVLEVWIDRNNQSVEKILGPPSIDIYFGMPVPIF